MGRPKSLSSSPVDEPQGRDEDVKRDDAQATIKVQQGDMDVDAASDSSSEISEAGLARWESLLANHRKYWNGPVNPPEAAPAPPPPQEPGPVEEDDPWFEDVACKRISCAVDGEDAADLISKISKYVYEIFFSPEKRVAPESVYKIRLKSDVKYAPNLFNLWEGHRMSDPIVRLVDPSDGFSGSYMAGVKISYHQFLMKNFTTSPFTIGGKAVTYVPAQMYKKLVEEYPVICDAPEKMLIAVHTINYTFSRLLHIHSAFRIMDRVVSINSGSQMRADLEKLQKQS